MSDGGGTEENASTMEVSAVQTVADTSVLQKHIRKLIPLLLEDGGEVPAALETALEEKSAVEQMRKFLADPQLHTILVERSALKGIAMLNVNVNELKLRKFSQSPLNQPLLFVGFLDVKLVWAWEITPHFSDGISIITLFSISIKYIS